MGRLNAAKKVKARLATADNAKRPLSGVVKRKLAKPRAAAVVVTGRTVEATPKDLIEEKRAEDIRAKSEVSHWSGLFQ